MPTYKPKSGVSSYLIASILAHAAAVGLSLLSPAEDELPEPPQPPQLQVTLRAPKLLGTKVDTAIPAETPAQRAWGPDAAPLKRERRRSPETPKPATQSTPEAPAAEATPVVEAPTESHAPMLTSDAQDSDFKVAADAPAVPGDTGAPAEAKPTPTPKPVEPGVHEVVGLPKLEDSEEVRSFTHLIGDTLVYPPAAIQQELQGTAILEVTVDATGAVASAYVAETSGHRILDEAALDAVLSIVTLPEWAGQSELLPVSFKLRD